MPRGVGRDAGAVEVVEVVGVRHRRHCEFGFVRLRLGCGMLVVAVCFGAVVVDDWRKEGGEWKLRVYIKEDGGKTMRCVHMTMILGNFELR